MRLRALLASCRQVTTERIASDLGVSRETVRRDVVELEAAGELRRVHGGVVAVEGEPEQPLDQRTAERHKEKREIARLASRLPSRGQTLFLGGASTTVSALAQELAGGTGLTIITNSIDIVLKLGAGEAGGAPRHEVLLLGGRPSGGTATFGETTIAEISHHVADWAFLSPVGLHATQGATDYDYAEAAVARAMSRQARRTAILADHSKIGVLSRVSFCAVEDIDVLVVDHRASKQAGFAPLRGRVGEILLG